MPGLTISSSSDPESSSSSPPSSSSSNIGTCDCENYPAASFPNYAEQPLERQLEPIAVVGMGCRLPGQVGSPAAFWDMMMKGGTGQTPRVPSSRFNIDAHFHKNNNRPGSFGVPGGYFLDGDLSEFDPSLFGITPIEAMWMDPQQRKLLEVVYEALESGGITIEAISGTRTAVFAASFTADWQQMSFKEPSFRHSLTATGVDTGIISNRISHVFNLNGPSIVCNTACSSSMYALHNACNALRNGEAEGAIVGGVNLIITVDQHMNTAKLGVLSPTSTCHTFDKSADGYGRADGVGAVYLKRLSDAIRDGDPIRGVIRSSATNSNGKATGVGITHPNREGQVDVITEAYRRGGDLDPRLTGYFECHGTGTPVGDPLEVHAVSMAMNKNRRPGEDPLLIGSVKTNIGHSEAASGLSALIRAVLIVERGVIPAVKGLVDPNPAINWKEWQIKAPTEPVPFPAHLPVRRVSINSFGYGGTNAHVIVEGTDSLVNNARQTRLYKYTHTNHTKLTWCRFADRQRPFLLPFSAHDKATLIRNLEAHAKVVGNYHLQDLAYTLCNRRSLLPTKGFTVANLDTVKAAFGDISTSFNFGQSAKRKKVPSIGFVFTGQGAQWAEMGTQLIQYSPEFRSTIKTLDTCLSQLHDSPSWSIEDVLLEPVETSPIHDPEFSQPLCTAVQVALVQLLEGWGIRPTVTVGHSSGEMAAAYAAGLVSARDAIVLAYYRGVVTSRHIATNGAMLAVGLGAEAVLHYLTGFSDRVVVACHNSPSGVTLSGDADAIEEIKTKLDAENIFARLVKTNGKAYHSHHMAPASDIYEQFVRNARVKSFKKLENVPSDHPKAKMISSVTNSVLTTSLDETYFSLNLRNPVLFNQALQTALTLQESSSLDLLLEIGPHSALSGPIKQIKTHLQRDNLDYLPSLVRGQKSAVQLLKLAGELFLRGYPINMDRVSTAYLDLDQKSTLQSRPAIIVDLPPYQWNYTRPFWAESRASREHRFRTHPRHDLLGERVLGSSTAEPTWRNILSISDVPWLRDHTIGGEVVFPAAGYFSMAMEAVTQLQGAIPIHNYVLRDVSIQKALVIPPGDGEGIEVLLNLRPSVYGISWWDFGVSSIDNENTTKEHMIGTIGFNLMDKRRKSRDMPILPQRASGKAWNDALRSVEFDYGPSFQDMNDIRFDGKSYRVTCGTEIKQQVAEGESRYVLHPASIDSVLQATIVAYYAGRTGALDTGLVPVQVDEVVIWPPTAEACGEAKAFAWIDKRGMRSFESGGQMVGRNGEVVLDIVNLRGVKYDAAVPRGDEGLKIERPFGEMKWEVDFEWVLRNPETVQGLTAKRLVELAFFKDLSKKIVMFGKAAEELWQEVKGAFPTATCVLALGDGDEIAEEESGVVRFNFGHDMETHDSFPLVSFSDVVYISMDLALDPSVLRLLVKPGGFVFVDRASPLSMTKWHEAGFISFLDNNTGSPRVYQHPSADTERPTTGDLVQLIYHTNPTLPVTEAIKTALETLDCTITLTSLTDISASQASIGQHIIFLTDLETPSNPVLSPSMSPSNFATIQSITNNASSLLWITPGGLLSGKHPEYAMVQGLARTLQSEQGTFLDFRTLDIDLDTTSAQKIVDSIMHITKSQLFATDDKDKEFCLGNNLLHISRLLPNTPLNHIFSPTHALTPIPAPLSPDLYLSAKACHSSKVIFYHSAPPISPPKPDQVRIRVLSSGLTKESVLSITGHDLSTSNSLSLEIGGIITHLGSSVANFNIGDRAIALHLGNFDTVQDVPASLVSKLDEDEDLKDMVGCLSSFVTALYGLEELARLQKGEKVLVLNGMGTVGMAVVRVAQAKGTKVFVAVNTDDERVFMIERMGVEKDSVYLVDEGISGVEADVVFSSSGSDEQLAREAWRSIARFGRFLDSGKKGKQLLKGRKVVDWSSIGQKGGNYFSFDLVDLLEGGRRDAVARIMARASGMLRKGEIEPFPPGSVVGIHLGGIDAAVAAWSDRFGMQKVVLTYEDDEKKLVNILPVPRERVRFDAAGTYLLVGCLGGLGRSLTTWMMEAGARRFVFLSRSGADSLSAARLVQQMESHGAVVDVVRGDATSRDDVVRAVNQVSDDHRIKGVVHAAMVLRDGLFSTMTFENWKSSVNPKVLGVANLHSVLTDHPLEFFLMTGSVSGILGNPTQSNYAAANTYLDSLARHRQTSCMPAASVVLPMVLGVGVVAENEELEKALTRQGMYGIDEEHLIEAFEAAILSCRNNNADHVVVGLDAFHLQTAAKKSFESGEESSFWSVDPRFNHTVHDMELSSVKSDTSSGGSNPQCLILDTIKRAKSQEDATIAVSNHLAGKLGRMLLLSEDEFTDIDSRSVASYGLDSMIGVEFRNWIFREFKFNIPFQQLLGSTLTITKLSKQLCGGQEV
ncbi:putative polyketide synthase [Podospora fimiseda]|uniref:Polyketide synthase n=1 Tax=Podospora fimiseda TaxID=252190 RepID=A0AAN6YLH6_9PEZI|nr:putative polyketide synthase [Podospora fimiseda]